MTSLETSEVDAVEDQVTIDQCCRDGRQTPIDLEHATLLKDIPGFEHITELVVEYRAARCNVAADCHFAETGQCALMAAGMQDIFPAE